MRSDEQTHKIPNSKYKYTMICRHHKKQLLQLPSSCHWQRQKDNIIIEPKKRGGVWSFIGKFKIVTRIFDLFTCNSRKYNANLGIKV